MLRGDSQQAMLQLHLSDQQFNCQPKLSWNDSIDHDWEILGKMLLPAIQNEGWKISYISFASQTIAWFHSAVYLLCYSEATNISCMVISDHSYAFK